MYPLAHCGLTASAWCFARSHLRRSRRRSSCSEPFPISPWTPSHHGSSLTIPLRYQRWRASERASEGQKAARRDPPRRTRQDMGPDDISNKRGALNFDGGISPCTLLLLLLLPWEGVRFVHRDRRHARHTVRGGMTMGGLSTERQSAIS